MSNRIGVIGLMVVAAACGGPASPDNPYGLPAMAGCDGAQEGESRCFQSSWVQVCRNRNWITTDDCGALGYVCAPTDYGVVCVGDTCSADEGGAQRCAGAAVEVCTNGLWVVAESCDQECAEQPDDTASCVACTHDSKMGEPCRADCDCASRHPFQVNGNWYSKEIEQICLTEAEYGFPGGWCTIPDCYYDVVSDPCNEFGYDCVPRGTLASGRVVSACMSRCVAHDDCREDTACQPLEADWQLCMPACPDYIDCGTGWSCTAEGICIADNPCEPMTCEEQDVECGTITDGCGHALDCGECPQGPLDGCANWSSGWSCTDLSPTLCSCSCYAWPHGGTAPRIECQWSGGTNVGCTCTTGGEVGVRQSASVPLSAGGASCGQAQNVFEQSFCGLVP